MWALIMGKIMRIGATRRRRMPIKVMMLTFTPAAQAEIQRPTGMKLNRSSRNTKIKIIGNHAIINIAVDVPPLLKGPVSGEPSITSS